MSNITNKNKKGKIYKGNCKKYSTAESIPTIPTTYQRVILKKKVTDSLNISQF